MVGHSRHYHGSYAKVMYVENALLKYLMAGGHWTVPELLLKNKGLIPVLQQLLVHFENSNGSITDASERSLPDRQLPFP